MEKIVDEGVIKSMYSVVQSAVLVGEEQTEWFDLSTGVTRMCDVAHTLLTLHQWVSERD